jgi:hypothetical protein
LSSIHQAKGLEWKPNRSAILSRLEWILSQVNEPQFNNRVFQLRDSTWLAYPPIAD